MQMLLSHFLSQRATLKRHARVTAAAAFSLFFAVSGAVAQDQPEHFDWVPPEAVARENQFQVSGEQIIPQVTILKTPMATADKSKFTKRYEVELEKFGIKNDGTEATATAKGINAALQHAKTLGANYIIFPKGVYLLNAAEYPIIIDHQNTIFDLNGATFMQSKDVAEVRHMAMLFKIVLGADNVRVTNGVLMGARMRNQIASGLHFESGNNIEVDHIFTHNFDGNGFVSTAIGAEGRDELLKRIVATIEIKNLQQGAFNDKGVAVDSTEKMRSRQPYDITKANGEFEIGYAYGYRGYPHVKGRVYQIYFFDADMKFISMSKELQYRKVHPPKNTRFVHVEFNQPEIPGKESTGVLRITNFTPSTNVHVHDNVVSNNVALGFSMCGGQRWIMENNLFIGNGGRAPGYAIDFEDGFEYTMDIVLRNNTFKDNISGDVVVVSGTELIFEDNKFEKNVVIYGRCHNYFFRNNVIDGGSLSIYTRTGVAWFSGNTYNNANLRVIFDTKAVADGLYRKPGETVATPPLFLKNETLTNMKKVSGTYLNFENAKIDNVEFTVDDTTALVRFINSQATNATINYEGKGPKVFHQITGTKGKIVEQGEGLNRRKEL